jgi:hypothetical protein
VQEELVAARTDALLLARLQFRETRKKECNDLAVMLVGRVVDDQHRPRLRRHEERERLAAGPPRGGDDVVCSADLERWMLAGRVDADWRTGR